MNATRAPAPGSKPSTPLDLCASAPLFSVPAPLFSVPAPLSLPAPLFSVPAPLFSVPAAVAASRPHRESGVRVGGDKPRPVPDGGGRSSQRPVVELDTPPHHEGIGALVSSDDFYASYLQSLVDACRPDHSRAAPRPQHRGGGLCGRGQVVGGTIDANPGQGLEVLCDQWARVVREENDSLPG